MKERLPTLDGLRGYACLFVVLSHLPWPNNVTTELHGLLGAVGVGVFFVLSGFLMGYLYIHKDFNVKSVINYSIARFSRIVPVYWFVILIYLLLSYLFSGLDYPFDMGSVTNALRHIFLIGSSYVFWSIPLEIQYYIFFIFLWYSFFKFSFLQKTLLSISLVILLYSFDLWPGLVLFSKLPFFLAGTFFGILPRIFITKNIWLIFFQVISVFLLFLPMFYIIDYKAFYDSFEVAVYYGVAIYFISHGTRFSNLIMSNKYMAEIGAASFSIYLIHLLLLYFYGTFLGLDMDVYDSLWFLVALVTIVTSLVFHKKIEVKLHYKFKYFLEHYIKR